MRAFLRRTSFLPYPFQDGMTCVLPISVGWDYHEGDVFQATIDLVNKRFSFCRVVVCDSLQRHSLKFTSLLGENEEVIQEFAFQKGEEWLERNKEALEKLIIPTKITRWNDYLLSDSYGTYLNKVNLLFQSEPSLSEVFWQHAKDIYSRFIESERLNVEIIDENDFIKSSIEYLLEECAVLLMWEETQEDIILYPRKMGPAMEKTSMNFWGAKRNFLNHLMIQCK